MSCLPSLATLPLAIPIHQRSAHVNGRDTHAGALEVLQGIEDSRPKDVAKRLGIQPVLLGRLLGFDLPDLGEIDSQSVIRLNERMD